MRARGVHAQHAADDDAGGVSEEPGSVGGRVLVPDMPSADSREFHQDHMHANLGHNGPDGSSGGVWELAEARAIAAAGNPHRYEA